MGHVKHLAAVKLSTLILFRLYLAKYDTASFKHKAGGNDGTAREKLVKTFHKAFEKTSIGDGRTKFANTIGCSGAFAPNKLS